MDQHAKGIMEMARGAFMEQVNYRMGDVIANMMDVNTPTNKPRKLTVTLVFAVSADRSVITVGAQTDFKPVPTSPVVTSLSVYPNPVTGKPEFVEMTAQIPGQLTLEGGEEQQGNTLYFKEKQGGVT